MRGTATKQWGMLDVTHSRILKSEIQMHYLYERFAGPSEIRIKMRDIA